MPPLNAAQSSFDQRLIEMQQMLTQMHALLKQMQSKALKTNDASAMDNVRMWELMLGHMDRSLAQARMTEAERTAMFQRAMVGRRPGAANGATPVQMPARPK